MWPDFLDHLPAAPDDDEGDEHREQRIDRRPIGEEDHGAGDQRRHRAEQIAEHVNGRAPDIEVLAVGAVQQREGGDIHEQAEDRHHHHDAAGDRLRRRQPLIGLVNDPRGDDEEREAVDEGDQHLEAVEAVGAYPVRRTPRQTEAEPGERQRGEVGEHVACVGEEGERA